MPDPVEQTETPVAVEGTEQAAGAVAEATPPGDSSQPLIPLADLLGSIEAHHKADPKATRTALRSHSIVGGVAGDIAEQANKEKATREATEAAEAARQKQLDDLLQLAEDDPEAFAEKFRTQAQADKARAELQNLELNAQRAVAASVRENTAKLPEFQEQPLTLEEKERLVKGLKGLDNKAATATYPVLIADILADRRAAKRVESAKPEWLKAEREAWEAESVGTRVRTTAAPTLAAGRVAVASDEPNFRTSPGEWLQWNEKRKRGG